MMYALHLKNENRIHSAWEVLPNGNYDDMPIVDALPEGDITDYLYINNQYVYDPLLRPEPVEPTPERSVWDELDAAYQEGVDSV